jgi:lipid II:glycine glycyltransferase (peptidoglycan interpeptide bridge formation enzyme)
VTAIHEATAEELEDWDAHTVDVPGGHVFQSRTWGEYRARHGWRPRHLVFDDGFRVLSAERRWPIVGGAGGYIARGPVPAGEPPANTADRLRAVADWLADRGVDVVSSDAEVPVDTGYPELLRARGFHQIEEVQPSRHRMSLELGADQEAVWSGFTKSLRQTIRTAEHRGLRLVRYDAAKDPDPEVAALFERPDVAELGLDGLRPVFERLHDELARTARRRGFPIAPRAQLIDSSSHAVLAGLAMHIEVRSSEDEYVGSLLFFRHGRRITYSLSADAVAFRKQFPGTVQLVLWRAIQVAVAEGLPEFDLAGVDIAGARRKPAPGEEMYGLFEMKERFGARWIDLVGNHEWVARPWRYAAGRVALRLNRLGLIPSRGPAGRSGP